MNFTVVVLLQSLLSLPPLGYVRTESGLAPLFGMKFNFVLGEPLPHVLSAVRLHGMDLLKLANEIRILNGSEHRIATADGPAFFAVEPGTQTVYAWLPDSNELIRWRDGVIYRVFVPPIEAETIAFAFIAPQQLQIFGYDSREITLLAYDAATLQPSGTTAVAEAHRIGIDTRGNRWTATDTIVMCGDRRWDAGDKVTGIQPLDHAWMLISTDAMQWAARCESEELSAIPQLGQQQ